MQAVRLLLRNADVVDVDAALKRDVGLSVKLLRYMNAAGARPGIRIESLRHAIALLGYHRLARWLTLLPAMLRVPMHTVLHDLELPAPVCESLLARSGAFAPYLKLAEACEDPSLAGVGPLCGALSISPKALNLAQVQAADWVRQLGL